MESVQPSESDLPVSPSVSQKRAAEVDSMRTVPQYALLFTPVSSIPECTLPSASPLVLRTTRRRCRPDEQPLVAPQEWSTEAMPVAEVASVRGQTGSGKKIVTGAQLAERRRVSETAAAAAASQGSNSKQAEVEVSERDEDEGDPTDVEADFEETTAMAMRDQVVQCQRLFDMGMGIDTENTYTVSLPPSQGSYSRHQDRVYKDRAHA